MRGAFLSGMLCVSVVGLSGCEELSNVVEVLVPDASGTYVFEDRELTTVVDLRTGESERFSVVGETTLFEADVLAVYSDPSLDRDALKVAAKEAVVSKPVSPRLKMEDGVVHAVDQDSLLYLTLYHHLEAVFLFFDPLPVAPRALAPMDVALFAIVARAEDQPISRLSNTNAAYFAPPDVLIFHRDYLPEPGLNFATNLGVVGHEFGHRVFFEGMVEREGVIDAFRAQVGSESVQAINSEFLFSAFSEGFSDLVGVVLTQDPAFFNASFDRQSRVLSGAFAVEATADNLYDETWVEDESLSADQRCTTRVYGEPGANFYCLGTLFTRSLFVAVDEDPARLRDEVLPAVLRALPQIGEAATVTGELNVTIPMFLEFVAAEMPPSLRTRTCDAFAEKMGTFAQGVAACLP